MAKKLPAPTSPEFLKGYLETALWSSTDESTDQGGEPLDANYTIEDIDDKSLYQAIEDCNDFLQDNEYLLKKAGKDDGTSGHNFWLNRNGHGAGFWDGDYGEFGDALSKACEKFKQVNVIVGDDGKLHFERG